MERDNQQVRDISWLAGLIDGEGCLTLQKRQCHNGKHAQRRKSFDLIPEISIINSNWLNIEHADKILKELKVGHYIYSTGNYGKGDHARTKPAWGIRITGLFRCKALLVEVTEYLQGKKKEAEILHAYICSRLSHPNKVTPYTVDEIKTYDVLRMLKQMSNPNDYTLDIFIDKMKI
jgi:hypothetical protein